MRLEDLRVTHFLEHHLLHDLSCLHKSGFSDWGGSLSHLFSIFLKNFTVPIYSSTVCFLFACPPQAPRPVLCHWSRRPWWWVSHQRAPEPCWTGRGPPGTGRSWQEPGQDGVIPAKVAVQHLQPVPQGHHMHVQLLGLLLGSKHTQCLESALGLLEEFLNVKPADRSMY